PDVVAERVRGTDEVRAALERMWPILTPAELLRDLFSSRALLKLASAKVLSDEAQASLVMPRGERADDGRWFIGDVPLLDEARVLRGPRPRSRDEDEVRTYGHIVVDEAQDLTMMQLRMLARRSLG